jgi:thiol:disulfide interchange protein
MRLQKKIWTKRKNIKQKTSKMKYTTTTDKNGKKLYWKVAEDGKKKRISKEKYEAAKARKAEKKEKKGKKASGSGSKKCRPSKKKQEVSGYSRCVPKKKLSTPKRSYGLSIGA